NRPGVILSVTFPPAQSEAVALVFAEIVTIGRQGQGVQRWALARERVEVEIPYGIVGVKVARSRYGAERVWLSSLGVRRHGGLTAELLFHDTISLRRWPLLGFK
nr:DUF111 family protein [Anaerolineae bacterium]